MDDGPVIVTGCQRSGTTIASHILGEEKKWVVWEDQDWLPIPKDIYILEQMIETGRTKLVIQSPLALHNFPYIFHKLPTLHWVGVKRKTSDIIKSMHRVRWYYDEFYHHIDYYHDHIRFMNNQWGLLKQMLPKESWTEVKYNELKEFKQFIPEDQRKDFTVKQWQLNKPNGPQYWSIDPYWREETPQTSNQSSELSESGESSQNTEERTESP